MLLQLHNSNLHRVAVQNAQTTTPPIPSLLNACFCCVRFSFFSIPSQETGLEKRLRNDLFCVEWDVKPQLKPPQMNSVNPRGAQLVLGWVTVFGRYTISMCNQQTRSRCPSGVTKSSTSFSWGKGGNVTSAGWQVTLCDPIWHVSSCSGEASC